MNNPDWKQSQLIELTENFIAFRDKKYKTKKEKFAFAFMPAIYLAQYLLICSQIKFPKDQEIQIGGIVTPNFNKNSEIITLPEKKTIIPNDITKQIAKEIKKYNLKIKIFLNEKEL